MTRVVSEALAPGAHWEPPPLSEREFTGIQRLLYREAGIWLSSAKKALVVGRLSRRLRELGHASFGTSLLQAAEDGAERLRLLEALCTHETHFFRAPRHFEYLAGEVCPAGAPGAGESRSRRVRVWSAGCSTGEEPFSLAMLLHHTTGRGGLGDGILATDLSTRVLEQARQARWPVEKAREIPTAYRPPTCCGGVGSQEAWMKARLREWGRWCASSGGPE